MHPYASSAYALAFVGLAQPLHVPALGTYVLLRRVEDRDALDAMGTYPLCVLDRQARISEAFAALKAAGAVSLVLVADVFFGPPPEWLAREFQLCKPFKTHYLHNPARPFRYESHHRYEVKRARAQCEVREAELQALLPEWIRLYAGLIKRHGVTGLQRFSVDYFTRLAAMPALRCHTALQSEKVLAMHLWIEHQGVLYSHLAASSDEGYTARAGYALNDFALERFRSAVAIDFGGGAASADDPRDGLARFKWGFSNETRIFHLCGQILDAPAYEAMCAGRPATNYFPAYRG